jgi:hypothetical protein
MSAASVFPVSHLPAQFGRYRLDKQLSQGEQTFTYQAHDTQLGRDVVLKIFQFKPAEGADSLQRFVQQVRTASTVTHPNLCPLYEAGQGDRFGYVAMAHVAGRRLSEVIAGGKALPQRQAAEVIGKVAQALHQAHQRNLAHRNLKPSNILIGPGAEPVVMNLGLVRRATPTNAFDTFIASPRSIVPYLAPEQLLGDERSVGPAADVYALGAILYEVLAGRPPFQGTPAEMVAQIRGQEPVPPSTYRRDLHPSLEAICRQAMAKQPQSRFPTMAAFAQALTGFLASQAEAAPAYPAGAFTAAPAAAVPPPFPGEVGPSPHVRAGGPVVSGHPALAAAGAPYLAGHALPPRGRRVWPWVLGTVTAVAVLLGIGAYALFNLFPSDKSTTPDPAQVAEKQPEPEKKPQPPPEPDKVDPDFTADKVETPDANVPVVRVESRVQVDALGDAEFTTEIKMPAALLATFKQRMSKPILKDGRVVGFREPKMDNVLRYLQLERAGAVMEKLGGTFGAQAIQANGRMRGWARHGEGHWFNPISFDPQLVFRMVKKSGRVVHVQALKKEPGLQTLALVEITLPPGAHNIQVEDKPNRVVFDTRTPKGSETNKGKPALDLKTKPHLMSALYKLYGDRRFDHLWAARSVFQNRSAETLTDFRVRFRIVGYSEWSRWERSDVVYPGQTVVDPFFPVIDAKVRELRGNTHADVEVEYRYARPGGEKVSDSHSERLKLLGINEGVYSDLPMNDDSYWYEWFKDAPLVLASFTSASDPVMQDVVGMVSKLTGGAGANLSDKNALAFMRELFNIFRANIAYETTNGDWVDGLLHQHLKYGRDVLRTKSGTCVNTSILYASACEAAGLHPTIILIPGHAFPAVRLPQSGRMVFVESTFCGGGTPATSKSFTEAVNFAFKEYQDAIRGGLLIQVDIHQQRQAGVTPPELPDAGKTPLKDWTIVLPTDLPPETGNSRPDQGSGGRRPRQVPTTALLGVWDVTYQGKAFLAYFDAKGKFGLGPSLAKWEVQGQYTYAANSLTTVAGDKKEVYRLAWSINGNAFKVTDQNGNTAVFRRKPISATVRVTKQEHNVQKGNRKGMEIHLHVQVDYAPGVTCEVIAFFSDQKGQLIKAKSKEYTSADGYLATFGQYAPPFPSTVYSDLVLFLPYDEVTLPGAGKHTINFSVHVFCIRDRKFVQVKPATDSFTLNTGD